MPTFTGSVVDHQIIIDVAVKIPTTGGKRIMCKALLDTGSQVTHISKRIIGELGLTAIGKRPILVASGDQIETETYRVRLDIPIPSQVKNKRGDTLPELSLRGKELVVSDLQFQPLHYDVVIGMDFLWGFHLTMYSPNFILSS